jgi:predicted transcriptional regulator
MHVQQALVADIMVVDPVIIHADASLEEVDIVMRATYSKGIPVVDSAGAFVGVISDADLAAYRFAHSQPPDEMMGRNEATNDARRGHRSSC